MIYLIAGVALWSIAHLAHRLVPGAVTAVPMIPRKIIIGLVLVFSIWLMIQGYPQASADSLWTVPDPIRHASFILMAIAFILYAGSYPGSALLARLRHPQLTGFKLWALLHIVVNGDVRSVVLFGGLLAWAAVEVIVINKQSGKPTLPASSDNALVALAFIPVGLVAWLLLFLGHEWLIGVSPLG